MKTVGIVCEYNPLHIGHIKQIQSIRNTFGEETGVVCLMSGNYVQRGLPAIFDKSVRAEAAVRCGADLVLEMPITVSLSSAEGFASGSVRILSEFCDCLSFGAETLNKEAAFHIAQCLLSPDFSPLLKEELSNGLSFPAARQRALERFGICIPGVELPNNILAIEYCKAMLTQKSSMDVFPVNRQGDYHADCADPENPSATSLRRLILQNDSWDDLVPENARLLFRQTASHALSAGERAILAKLRNMSDSDFEALPYGSEGLWRKLMHAARTERTLDEMIAAVKSKRYTHTRITRMILCAFLGITQSDLHAEIPYVRVLAFNSKGRSILHSYDGRIPFRNPGVFDSSAASELEMRCGSLYGLFSTGVPDAPDLEKQRRIRYIQANGDGINGN